MSVDKEREFIAKPKTRWRVVLATSIALATTLIGLYSYLRLRSDISSQSSTPVTTPTRVAITALGRIEPEGEVIQLSAPSSISGLRVEKLLVNQGNAVKAGQIVALLEGYVRATVNVQQALDQVRVAQAKLSQIQAGAKRGEIDAQQAAIASLQSQLQGEIATRNATVARLQAELDNAQTEYNRYRSLYQQGAVSASVADSKRLQVRTLQQQLNEAQAALNRTVNTLQDQIREARGKLDSIQEVRPQDVQVAQAEVKSAISAVEQAKAEQELSILKSPVTGTVLKINTKPGEVVSGAGIMEIGRTNQMYVVAEVYQTDIQKVRLGQKAFISSTAFPGKLKGTVSEIGLLVDRQRILNINPGADTDRRIVEVKIRIDELSDNKLIMGLTNLQVDVAIQI
ncbi:MAG: ABC exporter membrane fusion protein [Richelia sp. RM2_1_2]|nr:ABC exporter membrane fusion protein [Richelia sp. SM2_1_7]NJM21999.1 ABC exporter membrane fusion protein [Richelia sp. SM1_7_0]NJN10420.1 ABC exporter membrane fusion protein [Richelia sp. RM1_1_1]NJO29198.1 ABC exporter membrane fusion protein [Richelia sp. SL_2_1]NJO57984.1 ABC exporter membrane fusion protein [Richelia sp. RM2_1_2]NJS16298.1 ABC exporter membrane fusion protein [Nostocaceae cyanobacterium CSU_2_110]